MAIVCKVITPLFFSPKEPYMIVLFVEEYENILQIGACDSPRYMQVYDVQKIYPKIGNVYEAQKRFVEEMKVGNREPIKLYDFTISDLTDGYYTSVQSMFSSKETHLRVGVYENNNERDVAKRMLSFCIDYSLFKWND